MSLIEAGKIGRKRTEKRELAGTIDENNARKNTGNENERKGGEEQRK